MNHQPSLHRPHDEEGLKSCIEDACGSLITMVITDNAASMLSFRQKGPKLTLRIHRIFLCAGYEILEEIGGWIKNKGGPTPLIREFIRQKGDKLTKVRPRRTTIKTQGRFYNLRKIYDEVNEGYFNGMVTAQITWGTETRRSAVRKRTLGSYNTQADTIRINPILDRKSIPRYFLAFIIYHEMLHAALGTEVKNSRRLAHTKEFRRRERLFADYERALLWEKKNLRKEQQTENR